MTLFYSDILFVETALLLGYLEAENIQYDVQLWKLSY